MIVGSSKQSVFLLLFLTLLAVVVDCNKYSKDSRQSRSCRGEFCEPKDEYDEPCIDDDALKGDLGGTDDEPEPSDDEERSEETEDEPEEFDYPKEGLFRWDPVKVSFV